MAKNWQRSEFVPNFLTKFSLFDKQKKWKPKASELFWHDFTE